MNKEIIEHIMGMLSENSRLSDILLKTAISDITTEALKGGGEITFSLDKESESLKTYVNAPIFFEAHAAGRLIESFYRTQKEAGKWDDYARNGLFNLLAGGITYAILDRMDNSEKVLGVLDAAYSEGLAVMREIAGATFDTGKDSRETIEKQQEEIRKLKLQVEYLQYALGSMDSTADRKEED